jgi:hypothetical protein
MVVKIQRLMVIALTTLVSAGAALAQQSGTFFQPGNLVVSRTVYDNNPNIIQVGTILPPNCEETKGGCSGAATNDGTYPFVWNNALIDGSFGITSAIILDQITPSGTLINSLDVPSSLENGPKDHLVTSFSSKSELALNVSTDNKFLTFMGYVTTIGAIDVSNSNTPGAVDSSNPVGESFFRAVAQVDQRGDFHFTESNAYSGNNGRAAILNDTNGANLFYTSGNAGNGGTPQPDVIIVGAGAQTMNPATGPEIHQSPKAPTPVASFNVTQLGDPEDKIGKDDNFRGLTIFNNVLYYSKGSGGNGINSVYFVDSTGTVCTDANGVGLPAPNGTLPTSPLAYNRALLQTKGLDPNNMCILNGFPTALSSTTSFPFGIWFANANTLYVADEGNGDNTFSNGMYTMAATQTTAGLQKWVFDSSSGSWSLAYTLQSGLGLGVPYGVPGYPRGNNPATGLPWGPGTDGLRNITGVVNGDGTATIYAITSTVSGGGDQGADPNRLVTITDNLAAGTLPPGESFTILRRAGFGEALRGVSFTPGSPVAQ